MTSSPKSKLQVLRMDTRTWTRDSHGLFDYETSGYIYEKLSFNDKGQIFRQRTDGKILKTVDSNANTDPNNELLITVNKKNDDYTITNILPKNVYPTATYIKDLTQKVWYILNSEERLVDSNEDYYLNPNDIIKLGRVKYVINEYHINKPGLPEQKEQSYNIGYDNYKSGPIFDMIYQADRYEESKGEDKLCKICYSNENDDSNPLVHLCACTGGIRFAHFTCLRLWMQTKLTMKENANHSSKSYMLKGFNCEICQKPYPFQFVIKGKQKVFALVDIKRPVGEYLVLESLNQMKDKINTKIIHVIQLNQEQYIIGRGHECDVRINDISVSRAHATMTFNKSTKRLMLKDLKSKFGTLVLIKAPLSLTQRKIQLQVGRTVFETHLVTSNIEEGVLLQKAKSENKKMNEQDYGQNIMKSAREKGPNENIVQTKDNQLNNSDNGDDLSN